jgi:molybdopterin synthase sulfur carrier subunit
LQSIRNSKFRASNNWLNPPEFTQQEVCRKLIYTWVSTLLKALKMSVAVSIPTILRSYTNNSRSVSATGETLEQVIADLESQFPGIAGRLIEDGKLRRFVNIYINDEDVRFTGSLEAPVSEGDSVTVLPAVAGG